MNKIFNINLGGYPFTIDEDAYEHLNAYLKTIHRHFRQSEGYEEITEDIEARLAELFQERLGNRPIVSMKDVKEVIVTMGTPEEFGADPLTEPDTKGSATKEEYKTGKRLFRNPEEEVIGGVASGISAYFGIEDPIWIRIAFIVLVVSGGFGIPLYIILWAVLPKAGSASDRLAMRGEPINVSNIGKIIEEEFKNFSDKVTELGEEIGSKKKSFSGRSEARGPLAKGVHLLGSLLRGIIDVLKQVGKPLLILVALALLLAFAVSWIVSLVGLFYGFPFLEYLNPGHALFSMTAPLNLLFLIGVPLISLGLFITRLAFGRRVSPKWKGAMWAFWAVNVVGLFFWGSMIARDFSAGTEISDRFYLQQLDTDTLSLTFGEDPYKHVWYDFGDHLKFTGDELISKNVYIELGRSESDNFELVKEVYSQGRSLSAATELAKDVKYELKQEGDRLILSPAIAFPQGDKWRNQKVYLKLKVPQGKFVRLDKSLGWQVRQMDLAEGHERVFWKNTLWRMESDGLACLQCPNREDEKYFQMSDFNKVKIDGNIKINIDQKEDSYEVRLEGREHFLEDIEVVQIDQTLMVSTEKERFPSPVYLHLSMPRLAALYLENTNDVKINGLEQTGLELNIKGGSDLKAYLDVDSLRLTQYGRNALDLRGRCGWLQASLSDHARLNMEKTEIGEANLDVSNYSNVFLPKISRLERKVEENSKVVVDGEQ